MRACPEARRREFEAVVAHAAPRPGEVLLDVPSGGGYLLPHLPDPRPAVHLVETVASFRDACPQAADVTAHLCTLPDLPLADASVDVAVSIAGCHHLEDKPAFWREVHRVLRPGGRFVLADVEEGTPPARFLNGFVAAHNSHGHDGRFLGDGTRGELERAGFAIEHATYVAYPWTFPDRPAMARFAIDLFGLDRATPQDVLHGIDAILGTEETAEGVALSWGLHHAVARRPYLSAAAARR